MSQQVYATLYDYPRLKQCRRLQQYIKDSVKLTWALSVQTPPLVIQYDSKLFKEESHTRFHSSDPESNLVKSVLWPGLLEGENGPCLAKGVVITWYFCSNFEAKLQRASVVLYTSVFNPFSWSRWIWSISFQKTGGRILVIHLLSGETQPLGYLPCQLNKETASQQIRQPSKCRQPRVYRLYTQINGTGSCEIFTSNVEFQWSKRTYNRNTIHKNNGSNLGQRVISLSSDVFDNILLRYLFARLVVSRYRDPQL